MTAKTIKWKVFYDITNTDNATIGIYTVNHDKPEDTKNSLRAISHVASKKFVGYYTLTYDFYRTTPLERLENMFLITKSVWKKTPGLFSLWWAPGKKRTDKRDLRAILFRLDNDKQDPQIKELEKKIIYLNSQLNSLLSQDAVEPPTSPDPI